MATATLRRSSWGLGTDRAIGWRERAACRGMWTEFTEGDFRGNGGTARAGRIAHICLSHCPVRRYCDMAARRARPVEVIQAGRLWPQWRNRPPMALPDPGCGPWCAHMRGDRP